MFVINTKDKKQENVHTACRYKTYVIGYTQIWMCDIQPKDVFVMK